MTKKSSIETTKTKFILEKQPIISRKTFQKSPKTDKTLDPQDLIKKF